ncbi:MAG: fumarylacetoacetate hydrolase family protein [Bacteroidota bacterium]|nr:fumarylacetoacetate hydrolase family protein [Bacteroidota bacterium]
MKLYQTSSGNFLEKDGNFYPVTESWNSLINRDELYGYLTSLCQSYAKIHSHPMTRLPECKLLAPIGSQEVWAAGVTYLRSREARKQESEQSGAAHFYSKVYDADRPELFFKANPQRVAAPNTPVYIRKDSKWNVPEPELTLFINSQGKIQGYTIGNDMSSRDIEGENPLYLPQAKIYDKSASLGPCLSIPPEPLSPSTNISLEIYRNQGMIFESRIQISQIKRNFDDLVRYLFRECTFESGVFLMTGTGIVPPNDFSLMEGDIIEISIDSIGKLVNTVSFR